MYKVMQACSNPGRGINEEKGLCAEMNRHLNKHMNKHLKCYANIIYNMYQTLTPFEKKGGCITWARLMRIYTIFIFLCFKWYIYSLFFLNVHHLAKNITHSHTQADSNTHFFQSIFLESMYKIQTHSPVVKRNDVQINKLRLLSIILSFTNHSSWICFALGLCGEQRWCCP